MATSKKTSKKASKKAAKKAAKKQSRAEQVAGAAVAQVIIPAPNFGTLVVPICGDKLVSNRFSQEAKSQMAADMLMTPEQKRKHKADIKKNGRPPKDFEKEYKGSLHVDVENGKFGISVIAIKQAMVRACKAVGVVMTDSKMFFDVVPDGFNDEGMGIYHITKGKPRKVIHHVRNANGSPDLRARAMFDNWEATITLRYDKDQINQEHVVNLLARAGLQVGIGAGRQFSTNSCGMGWGSFNIKTAAYKPVKQAA